MQVKILKGFIYEHFSDYQVPFVPPKQFTPEMKESQSCQASFSNVHQPVYNSTVGVHVKAFL